MVSDPMGYWRDFVLNFPTEKAAKFGAKSVRNK
jgi:hypothetical protein